MTNADVVIIGSGPGGGMAAYRLAKQGVSVIIVEKENLPRSKPCGGALPYSVKNVIEWDFSAVVEAEVHKVNVLYNHAIPAEHTMECPILLVNRSVFDLHIIEHALEAGHGSIRLMEGTTVSRIEEDEHGVSIYGNGCSIRCQYLIGADGAFGVTATQLGLRRRLPMAAAIDAEIHVKPDVFDDHANKVTFNFGCLPDAHGYAWIFPKNGYLSCGVESLKGKSKLQLALAAFVEKSFPGEGVISIKRSGHPIPLYSGEQSIATRRVCLVGDAASLVDPVMGEGILFALKSGALAGDVLATLLGAQPDRTWYDNQAATIPNSCLDYQTLVAREISDNFEQLNRFIIPLYLKDPKFFYKKFFYQGLSYFNLAQTLVSVSGPISP